MVHHRGRPTGCGAYATSAGCLRNNSPTGPGSAPATVARLERQPAAPCRCRTLGRLAAALDEDPPPASRPRCPEQPRRAMCTSV